MQTGTIKSYNPHKGWGFIECNGQDTFVNKKDLKGYCPSKGNQVQFEVTQSEKGAQATNVTVLGSPEELSYFGQIKSFNPNKGYGFITCEAFPGKDIFVLKSELPAGYGPIGGQCKFKVQEEGKGPSARDVMLLGSAGQQAQQMSSMTYADSGYGKGWDKGWGKGGWDYWDMPGKGGYGGYDPWMGMIPPPWKGYGKGYGW
ncbi:Cold shock-like protein CspLB [Symbiodinium microadriaticum]|uniref:Cold shock-like protein CspLB n=1 Tax=Symbiodinium microadriaticum TaxID=2951 RepID=A0A1Q9E521_SYMMI|nr:Cold shock-like protein CspLB [Symbiodinium microadriaticum]CAE7844501.1 cspLB [Symbiodinium microadriaticum]CAE7928243.1 cspLB [Symbiodinium sp. KB8]